MAVNFNRRVDFPMVDSANIMYYPVYWDLAHRFFEEAWEVICGIDYPTILHEHKLGFPAVHNECDFHRPLTYGDVINCTIWIERVGTKSCTWAYQYHNQDGELVWTGKMITVCATFPGGGESVQIPDWLKEGLLMCTSPEGGE